jgi:hypothetical protein
VRTIVSDRRALAYEVRNDGLHLMLRPVAQVAADFRLAVPVLLRWLRRANAAGASNNIR